MVKKKIELLETFGGSVNELTVQKSKPLFALWQSELTLAEFKILDTYLGRINSHDDEHRTVKFQKGELEELLGLKQLKPQVLDERLKHLMTSVRLPDEASRNGFIRISLFEKAYAEQDEYGVWEVELTCTESAKRYIFNIEEIQYLRYKLKNIINIKSRYTYILFLYIYENKYRGTWEISLKELKELLCCQNEKTYKQFKRFNDLILKKIYKEIHSATDIQYSYETVKKGRAVVAIRFTYIPKQILEDVDERDVAKTCECVQLWQEPLIPFQFSQEEYDELFAVLATVPNEKLPPGSIPGLQHDLELMRFHYLDQKATELMRRDSQKPIKNKFAYLIKMLKSDAKGSP